MTNASKRFQVGDGVHWHAGTDIVAGTVVRANGKSVWVVEDKATLLNGFNSGEDDALRFSPSGFVGHTSGEQRYRFEPGNGEPIRFSLRRTGDYKLEGTSVRGSMSTWGVLRHERRKHYDYNF